MCFPESNTVNCLITVFFVKTAYQVNLCDAIAFFITIYHLKICFDVSLWPKKTFCSPLYISDPCSQHRIHFRCGTFDCAVIYFIIIIHAPSMLFHSICNTGILNQHEILILPNPYSLSLSLSSHLPEEIYDLFY